MCVCVCLYLRGLLQEIQPPRVPRARRHTCNLQDTQNTLYLCHCMYPYTYRRTHTHTHTHIYIYVCFFWLRGRTKIKGQGGAGHDMSWSSGMPWTHWIVPGTIEPGPIEPGPGPRPNFQRAALWVWVGPTSYGAGPTQSQCVARWFSFFENKLNPNWLCLGNNRGA